MRIAPTIALATLLSPFALLPRGPMSPINTPAQTQSSAASGITVDRLDPALDQLIAPGTVPERLATGFNFTEGPMWRGNRLWFVDEEGDKIHAVTADGHVSTLVDYQQGPYALPNGSPLGTKTGPNAMATAQDGTVVAMQQYARDVVHLTEHSTNTAAPVKQTPFFDNYNGKHLNSPNDVVFAPDGSFYFTDPNYGLKQGAKDPAKQLPYQAVFHVKNGKPEPVITDLATPNGIALSPDSKTLYVNNSGPDQRIVAYPIHPDGTVGTPRNIITFTGHEGHGVPDGLKVDSRGNLWSTGPGGIRILTPQGKVLGQIKLPETAANLAWGDADGKTLYITAQTSVYKLQTLTTGNLPLFRR